MPRGKPLTTRTVGPTPTTAADVRTAKVRATGLPEVRLELAVGAASSIVARAAAPTPELWGYVGNPANPARDHTPEDRVVVLNHNGHKFSMRTSMALIFQKNAARVRAAGESQLVVLAHAGGVELLLITPTTPFHFDAPLGAVRIPTELSARQPTALQTRKRPPTWPHSNASQRIFGRQNSRMG